MSALAALEAAVHECRRCPRLVAWREQVAREKRAAFRDEAYWGRPIAGFGDPRRAWCCSASRRPPTARTAPAGSSRATARATSSSPRCTARASRTSRSRSTAATGSSCATAGSPHRCAARRRPTSRCPSERDNCAHWLRAELPLLERARVVVCLGAFAWESGLRQLAPGLRPRPRFGHGAEARVGELLLLGCFHPSQQNTFTGKLTPAMLDAVLERARELAAVPARP